MDVLRVLFDGPVLLLSGIVLVMLGGAGLLSTGGASHSRLRSTKPVYFLVQLGIGVLLLSVGATLVFSR
jgi:hypothetical protein